MVLYDMMRGIKVLHLLQVHVYSTTDLRYFSYVRASDSSIKFKFNKKECFGYSESCLLSACQKKNIDKKNIIAAFSLNGY